MMDREKQEALADAIIARRAAADNLRATLPLIDAALRKLANKKSYSLTLDLKRIAGELREVVEALEDEENDPV